MVALKKAGKSVNKKQGIKNKANVQVNLKRQGKKIKIIQRKNKARAQNFTGQDGGRQITGRKW